MTNTAAWRQLLTLGSIASLHHHPLAPLLSRFSPFLFSLCFPSNAPSFQILPSYTDLRDVHLEWTYWRQCCEPFSHSTLRSAKTDNRELHARSSYGDVSNLICACCRSDSLWLSFCFLPVSADTLVVWTRSRTPRSFVILAFATRHW